MKKKEILIQISNSISYQEEKNLESFTNQHSEHVLTETVELGVLVPYPDEGREAKDQRRPSVLEKDTNNIILQCY